MTSPSAPRALIDEGFAALRDYDWSSAREIFNRVLENDVSAQALEGLALAAWWQDDRIVAIDLREQSYRLYREAGDARSAARMALWLSMDYYAYRGEPAISSGWLERARRLLENVAPCEEHCWVLYREAARTWIIERDAARALQKAREAVSLSRTMACTDMELLALSFEGVTLIQCGQVAEGMKRLDEVTAAIVAGEVANRWATGVAACNLITGCGLVRDYERAGEWCLRMKEYEQRWKHPPILAACRTLYADVLIARGEWEHAESELVNALAEYKKLNMTIQVEAIARLAELRRRQGRTEAARSLAAQGDPHPGCTLVCAELALDEGRAQQAADIAERYLRRANPDNCAELGAGLELMVRAQIALNRLPDAAAQIERLETICQRINFKRGQAALNYLKGLLHAARGEREAARRHLEDAADFYLECEAPYESGRARVALAQTLVDAGRKEEGCDQARRAMRLLERIGAQTEAQRASACLQRVEPERGGNTGGNIGGNTGENTGGNTGDNAVKIAGGKAAAGCPGLTPREQQVLRMIAQGHTNAEIAARLFLSEHTIHRHVSNILTKLGLPSRAAAVAFATSRGAL